MRKGFDTLAVLVREGLGCDPLSGHLFLFVGRRRDRLKILYWDRDGYALWYKRLEQGTFRMPMARPDATSIELKASELAMLLGRDRPAKYQAPQAIRASWRDSTGIPRHIIHIRGFLGTLGEM